MSARFGSPFLRLTRSRTRQSGAPASEDTRRDPARSLIFTHIPKTSGSALRGALERALRPLRLVTGFDRCLLGDFTAFETVSPEVQGKIFHRYEDLPENADLVVGHMAYSTTAAAYPDGQHMVVLREPVTRLMSHYLFWRGRPDPELAAWGSWGERVRVARGSFSDFLRDERICCQTDNILVRMLLWPHSAIPARRFIAEDRDADLIAAARNRLSQYDFVEAMERPDFASILGRWLGVQLDYRRENVTEAMPCELRADFAEALTPTALALVRRLTRFDAVLWSEVIGRTVDAEFARLGALLPAVARYGALMSMA